MATYADRPRNLGSSGKWSAARLTIRARVRWSWPIELAQAAEQRQLVGGETLPVERQVQLHEPKVELRIGRREGEPEVAGVERRREQALCLEGRRCAKVGRSRSIWPAGINGRLCLGDQLQRNRLPRRNGRGRGRGHRSLLAPGRIAAGFVRGPAVTTRRRPVSRVGLPGRPGCASRSGRVGIGRGAFPFEQAQGLAEGLLGTLVGAAQAKPPGQILHVPAAGLLLRELQRAAGRVGGIGQLARGLLDLRQDVERSGGLRSAPHPSQCLGPALERLLVASRPPEGRLERLESLLGRALSQVDVADPGVRRGAVGGQVGGLAVGGQGRLELASRQGDVAAPQRLHVALVELDTHRVSPPASRPATTSGRGAGSRPVRGRRSAARRGRPR